MAQTAVIAGTATAVSGSVANRQHAKAFSKDDFATEPAAERERGHDIERPHEKHDQAI